MAINISRLSYIPMTCLYDIFEAGVSLTKEEIIEFLKSKPRYMRSATAIIIFLKNEKNKFIFEKEEEVNVVLNFLDQCVYSRSRDKSDARLLINHLAITTKVFLENFRFLGKFKDILKDKIDMNQPEVKFILEETGNGKKEVNKAPSDDYIRGVCSSYYKSLSYLSEEQIMEFYRKIDFQRIIEKTDLNKLTEKQIVAALCFFRQKVGSRGLTENKLINKLLSFLETSGKTEEILNILCNNRNEAPINKFTILSLISSYSQTLKDLAIKVSQVVFKDNQDLLKNVYSYSKSSSYNLYNVYVDRIPELLSFITTGNGLSFNYDIIEKLFNNKSITFPKAKVQ